jgi:hypothetical protein
MALTFKLDRKAVDIGPEHIGHTVEFVDVVEDAGDQAPVCCAMCRTCGNPEDPNSRKLAAVVTDPEALFFIHLNFGELPRVTIEELTNGK